MTFLSYIKQGTDARAAAAPPAAVSFPAPALAGVLFPIPLPAVQWVPDSLPVLETAVPLGYESLSSEWENPSQQYVGRTYFKASPSSGGVWARCSVSTSRTGGGPEKCLDGTSCASALLDVRYVHSPINDFGPGGSWAQFDVIFDFEVLCGDSANFA